MYYFLDIEQQINRIFRVLDYEELRKKENSSSQNELHDILDGAFYKSLLEAEDGELLKTKEAMTFIFNTDGASICKKSGLTVWPVYLVVNEISNRFSLENVILAGKRIYQKTFSS
jgi:hypothetical protein